MHDARQQVEVRKFLATVRGQAIIEWKNDELKKLYEKQVAQEATPARRAPETSRGMRRTRRALRRRTH